MSTLETNLIQPSSGTTLTLGASGDTVTIPSGVTLTNNGTATGFGKVLQVVTATDSTVRTTTSTSFVTASNTLSVSITPSSASNKILILAHSNLYGANSDSFYTIFRGATNLEGTTNKGFKNANHGGVGARDSLGINYLDSPNTTSSITYEVRFRSANGAETSYLNESNCTGSITLLEIAG